MPSSRVDVLTHCLHTLHYLRIYLQYANDPEPIVADSCIVALDMLEHEQSGEFEYAETAA